MESTARLCELPRLLARAAVVLADAPRVRAAPTEFALVEHAWHVAELEVEAFQVRLERLAGEAAPWLPDFDGDRAASERGYLARSATAGVRAFLRARMTTVSRFARIRGRAWLRGGVQEGLGYVTLGELPERILAHDGAHASQLAALVSALRPGHALAGELASWASAIAVPPVSPCNRRASRARASSALLARVQHAIADGIAAGDLRTAALGRALGLSARTLQRRLAGQGFTVHCLVEESLRALALARVRGGEDWRVSADSLGFAAPRAFARAFKRWTHATPAAFQHAPAVGRGGCI